MKRRIHKAALMAFIEHEEHDRRTGRSTILALEGITKAMQTPGECIQMRDHYGTTESHRHLVQMAAGIVKDLGLNYFTFNPADFWIRYDPYVDITL